MAFTKRLRPLPLSRLIIMLRNLLVASTFAVSAWIVVLCFAQAPQAKKKSGAVAKTSTTSASSAAKFASPVITSRTPGHAVDIDVDLNGAKELHLVVTDGGNGFACDWADWAEPRLILTDGKERKLTELKWKSARADWGQVRVNQNAEGGALRINGRAVEYGIGTHANSVIAFDLPAGVARLKARAGLDNGGTDQGGGASSSVQFLIFTEAPPAALLAAAPAAGQDSGQRDPAHALEGLDVAPGLEATLFAAEPTMLSPTNLDVDHRGRVWVCEVVNYRHRNNSRPEGDRILILEDSDGDGKADKTRVFHQGRDIDTAHGICVLGTPNDKGTKVIISVGSGVYILHDDDGDLKSDRKTTLFTGISGTQHDHGIHAFLFGPDGKLYFNFGNEGRQLKDAAGKPIVDKAGNIVQDKRQPYQEGMVFRCNLDGTELETLGWNFRNNWEVTYDSFGTLWQSDNDDDGNRGVRINYVMEFGNYGYKDEFTGAGWNSPYTGQPSETPLRHWHLTDPGVMPNLVQTGAGSPTGICVYEGTLLPKAFHNQVIHCDAGPNIVRAYPVVNDGAGYKGEIVNILEGARDKWFRPSDVCVAPDGSLIIADWYDPGVGGHRMGDIERGRIFRVAPPKTPYKTPQIDVSTVAGAIEALKSPNLATRQLAWTALHAAGAEAVKPLVEVLRTAEDQRLRARALWLLSKGPNGREHVEGAIGDKNSDIRITALRAARQMKLDVIPYIRQLSSDKSPQVRRECLIALRHHASPDMATLWTNLAKQYDGQDRWYLEALGIAADKNWDKCLAAWLSSVGNLWTDAPHRDIIWRSRAKESAQYLTNILRMPSLPEKDVPRFMRALDFQAAEARETAAIELLTRTTGTGPRQDFIIGESLARLKSVDLSKNAAAAKAVEGLLDRHAGTPQFVALVDKFNLKDRYGALLALAQSKPDEQVGVDAAQVLVAKNAQSLVSTGLNHKDELAAIATVRALGNTANGAIVNLLRPIADDAKRPLELRRAAIRAIAKTQNGAKELINRARAKKLDESLAAAAAFELQAAPWAEVKSAAEQLFPLPPARNNEKLPPISQLVKMRGDVARGAKVFAGVGTCAKCHKVNGEGKEVGPDLSAIGGKLSREAFFESVLFPSAGISHNFETYNLQLESGNTVSGVVRSQTADEVTIVTQDAITRTFKRGEIERMEKSKISMMPADLQKVMSAQELADVVEYMSTLKGKK